MPKYRDNLPQLDDKVFLTDGGMETYLVFKEGIELREFAAFELLNDKKGSEILLDWFSRYAKVAVREKTGFILDSATWRASEIWGHKLGYSNSDLEEINLKSIELLERVRHSFENDNSPFVISGTLGPKGDGYFPSQILSESDAESYHKRQIKTFAESNADMVAAYTMTYSKEAIGIVRAANSLDIPVVISFTVETNGNLPSGETLKEAVECVDSATEGRVAYYMLNCAHPSHFQHVLNSEEPWLRRLKGIRANASSKSHKELDESSTLDDGDPIQLGREYKALGALVKNLNVLGGCCGTDHRHIEQICAASLSETNT